MTEKTEEKKREQNFEIYVSWLCLMSFSYPKPQELTQK